MRSTTSRRARGARRNRAIVNRPAEVAPKPGGRRAAHGSAPRGSGGDPLSERGNLYDEVTRRIIADLEQGRVPWVQPWGRTGGAVAGLPRNALTERAYSGVNILILWGAVIEHGYPSQGWLTFRQALQAGGVVRTAIQARGG